MGIERQGPFRVLLLDLAADLCSANLTSILKGAEGPLQAHCDFCQMERAHGHVLRAELQRRLAEKPWHLVLILLPAGASADLLELLGTAWRQKQGCSLLLIWQNVTVEEIELASRFGMGEFCLAPVAAAELIFRMRKLLNPPSGENLEVRELKEKFGLLQIIGQSPGITRILQKLPMLSRSGATLLITGETGTGKEVIARAVHYLSDRSSNSFVAINCGAVPTELMENELFGHTAGAFTGAAGAREGLIAQAAGGTLFLDEIDTLPLPAQVKLLRLLQEKEYRPLGSGSVRKTSLRVLAASNSNLNEAIHQGRFRQDLFYRLSVLSVRLPPLRERTEDLLLLAEHFRQRFAEHYGKAILGFSEPGAAKLLNYDWPGNVRELENVVERSIILCEGPLIDTADIELNCESEPEEVGSFQSAKARMVRNFETEYVRRVLAMHKGNITQAARTAGKNRRALFELIRRYRIQVRDFAGGGLPPGEDLFPTRRTN